MFEDVLRFWFEETAPPQWFKVDPAFDTMIRERFSGVHAAAAVGELHAWRLNPHGRLAEVIVLDQFSRNMFRGTARAFASDTMALVLAQEAVAGGHDAALTPQQRAFLYLPYMHSESAAIHVEALRLFEALGIDHHLDYERRHKAIVDRFGRYPHRNEVLGRESTPEEIEFLKQPGSRF